MGSSNVLIWICHVIVFDKALSASTSSVTKQAVFHHFIMFSKSNPVLSRYYVSVSSVIVDNYGYRSHAVSTKSTPHGGGCWHIKKRWSDKVKPCGQPCRLGLRFNSVECANDACRYFLLGNTLSNTVNEHEIVDHWTYVFHIQHGPAGFRCNISTLWSLCILYKRHKDNVSRSL